MCRVAALAVQAEDPVRLRHAAAGAGARLWCQQWSTTHKFLMASLNIRQSQWMVFVFSRGTLHRSRVEENAPLHCERRLLVHALQRTAVLSQVAVCISNHNNGYKKAWYLIIIQGSPCSDVWDLEIGKAKSIKVEPPTSPVPLQDATPATKHR